MNCCCQENRKVDFSGNYHGYEYFVIFRTNAIVYPYAMMVKALYASIALPTVLGLFLHVRYTSLTVIHLIITNTILCTPLSAIINIIYHNIIRRINA